YAREVERELIDLGIRVFLNGDNETFGKKIRSFTVNKAPYVILLRDNEVSLGEITVKSRDAEGQKNFEIARFFGLFKK
ncbi:MAG: hypothetical protein LBH37_03575, partial [Oscillospiraceae bacterium]|nr:hypothetical protein [Oscillospiraceae bacterium]